MNFFNIRFFILIFIISSCSYFDEGKKVKKPNILLIVADDLGYSDLGCFGSEIHTPNIDNLSREGVIFSNFHTSTLCAPSRAMLLSGNDNHLAGIGIQGFESEFFGYEGRLTDRIVTIPSLLRKSGYHTYISGKWHLGSDLNSIPIRKGFEKSFVLLTGAGNHYSNRKVIENYPDSSFSENGKRIRWIDGNYSTDYYTDKIIEYIDSNKEDKKPFFAFASYTSPHWPLQVDKNFSNNYKGKYDNGYDKLKTERFDKLKDLKIIPQNAVLPNSHKRLKSWKDLSSKEKKIESRKMELYAGMIENLDFNIGRIIQYLKEIEEYKNTVIVFMSDNGAAAEDFYNNPVYGPYLKENFTVNYNEMGSENSFISLGTGWAEASSAPFKYFKGFSTQGGIVSPIIISGYGINRRNQISNDFITLLDIAPTFYDFANVTYPENRKYPLQGNSLKNYLLGTDIKIHNTDYVFGFEHSGYTFIRKGDWKLVNYKYPFNINNFELYNLKDDIGESIDLSSYQNKKYNELIDEWNKFSTQNKIIIPSPYVDNIN